MEQVDLVAALRGAVDALEHEAVAAHIVQADAWGVDDKAHAVWAKMQSTRKGKFPWNKQKPPRDEGEEGEDEPEAEAEEEEEEDEPVDFADEEWQGETADEIFGERTPHKFTVAKVVRLGVYAGGRAPRPADADVPFDAMVTARSGYGVNLAPGGAVYAGYFEGNERAGSGAMLYPKTGLYVGAWKGGLRHGHGTMAYADGSIYEGAWAFGKRHGKGTFVYANGDRYVGHFFNGVKEGTGVYRAVGAETKFEASFGDGQLLAGKALTADGSAYYGTFKKGAADGKGAWALSNGVVAEGVFVGKLPDDADPEDEGARLAYHWQGGALSTVGTATDEVLRATLCIVKPKPKIVIAGPPAGGKGTQCELIKAHYGCHHISTGDMLRAAAADEENEIGQKAKEKMEAGELVPDELICGLLKQELEKPEVSACACAALQAARAVRVTRRGARACFARAGEGKRLAARWLPEDRRAGQGDGAHVHRAEQGARRAARGLRACARKFSLDGYLDDLNHARAPRARRSRCR